MDVDSIIKKLLANRGLTDSSAIAEFFSPPHPSSISSPFSSEPAIQLIKQHLADHHKIAIYGDYDVDGITSTAILWETLYSLSKNVFPHIPHRREEGYGLTTKGIDHCLDQGAKLIITADNGIVAHSAVDYCRSKDCDIIIIDHHQPSDSLPAANVILHSTSTCAAGLSWFFCRDFTPESPPSLDLVSIAVVCDLVPLLDLNRSFVKHGLAELNRTNRPGLLALFSEAGITPPINSYHCGFIIGPRLNSTGRLSHALDSLRLLCTTDPGRATELAGVLGQTNRTRQDLTESAVVHALQQFPHPEEVNLLVVADPSYDEGVIGLIAAKLVEKFHRPALAISVGPEKSKGSARSITGFDITAHLRTFSTLLTEVGGHAMAAGFSLESAKLTEFTKAVNHPDIDQKLLIKKIRVDAEIPLSLITLDLYSRLQSFAPFGLGNPQPIFSSVQVPLSNPRHIGKKFQHLKFTAGSFDAIYFNSPPELELPPLADLIYSLDLNTFSGRSSLQLIVKNLTI